MSGDAVPPLPEPIWRTLAERASDGIFVADARYLLQWVNPSGCELLGYALGELVGQHVTVLFEDVAAELARQPLVSPPLPGPHRVVRRLRRKDGRRLVAEMTLSDLGDGRLLGIGRDVTSGVAAQEAVARSEASFRAVIDGSPDGIVVHHAGRIVFANAAIARMLGYDRLAELHGMPILEAVHPDNRAATVERVRRLNSGEATVPFSEVRLLRRDGTEVHASVGGLRVEFQGLPCVVAICRDITEQRRVQAHLVEADRMVALGTLSAGIAHEINNPLTYLLLHLDATGAALQRLRAMLGGDSLALVERVASNVAIAHDGATRVRDIVRDLRVFARTADDQRGPIDILPAVERAIAMTSHELRQRAAVVAELGALPKVSATDGRLTQVFVNLLINAAHAIGDGDPDLHRVVIRAWTEDGDARVSVSDTGGGVAPEHLPHIFDPFFTTKPVGEGSGLGLAIVHGIVTGLGGSVRCHSRPGEGTTFVVALPAHAG